MKVLEPGSSSGGIPVSDVSIGSGELWLPAKELFETVEVTCKGSEPSEQLIRDVDRVLTRHAADFASLFGVKPPNPVDREELKKCSTEGAYLKGYSGKRVIAYSLVNEAMLLSDLFHINEFLALDLLTTAENEMENYESWPRGLVAVYMYYQGRYWLIASLATMIRICPGRTWHSRLQPSILQLFRRTLNSVFREDMIDRLIVLLEHYNLDKQLDILEGNLALGDWRHRRKIKSLLCTIKENLANAIFYYGAQREVRWAEVMRVMDYLKTHISPEERPITKDDVTLIASALYSIEYNLDTPDVNLSFGHSLKKYLRENEKQFKCMELWDVYKLGFLSSAHKAPTNRGPSPEAQSPIPGPHGDSFFPGTRRGEDKELLADEPDFEFVRNVFGFLQWEIFSKPSYYSDADYISKVFHGYLADFIIYMPLKLKEIKYRSEETAKTILVCQEQGINPQIPDVPEYESFLECLGEFYEHDPHEMGSFYFMQDTQYLALSKLVRSCCLESPALFLSSMRFLNGVVTGNPAAMFELLKQNGHNASLEHFFESILKYLHSFGASSVSEEGRTMAYINSPNSVIMNPMEIRGICSYLRLVETVCTRHEPARIFFTHQKPSWIRAMMQTVKIRVIPREIRASVLTTCAAMIGSEPLSPEVVSILWDMFYQTRLIDPGTGDVKEELEEKETRLESYALTIGMLKLLKALVCTRFKRMEFISLEGYFVHPTYDNGAIFPYVNYVVDSVLLKTPFRLFKDMTEKWTVVRLGVEILSVLLDYLPKLMMQLLCDSPLIRTVFNSIIDCSLVNERRETGDVVGEHVEMCSLELLNLIWRALQRQPFYMMQRQEIVETQDTLLLVGIHELIMRVGGDHGKPEYMLGVIRFIDTLMSPEHRLAAIEILSLILDDHSEIDSHINASLQWQSSLAAVFRHTLVETLYESDSMSGLSEDLKLSVLNLLRKSVVHSDPNVGFFLLGVDSNKMDYVEGSRTLLHGLLDNASQVSTSFLTLLILMSDPRLCTPTIRYLRYSKFFQPYIREEGRFEEMSFEGLSYFLKCLAVELKTEGGINTASELVTTSIVRLEQVLEMIQLESHSVNMPDLEFFDGSLVMQAIATCEFVDPQLRTKLIRVEMLEGMLKDEIGKLEKSTVLRLRKTVHTEAKDILNYARALNTCREKEGHKLSVFDGWRQVVEVLMLTPQIPTRHELVSHCLRMLLGKVLATKSVTDYFYRLAAESTLTACAVMAQTCEGPHRLAKSGSMLNIVINDLCQWIASAQSQKVRSILYAGLLYCVNILQKSSSGETILACQNAFPLILDNLCRDCCQSQGSGKMQALYLTGEIIRCTTNRGLGAAAASATMSQSAITFAQSQDWGEGFGDEGLDLESSQLDLDPREESFASYNNSFIGGLDQGAFSSTRIRAKSSSSQIFDGGRGAADVSNASSASSLQFIMKPKSHSTTKPPSALGSGNRPKMARSAVSSTIMQCVYTNGFLSTVVESLCVIDDLDLVQLLTTQVTQSAMRAYFVFEAKMSMLTRLSSCGLKAVLYLLDLNLVKRLTDMKVFELHNYQSEVSQLEEPSPAERSTLRGNDSVQLLYSRKDRFQETSSQILSLNQTQDASDLDRTKQENWSSMTFSPSQRTISEQLYVQVFKLFHTMLDSGSNNVIVLEQILHFLRVHDESVSKMIRARILVERQDQPKLSAILLTSLLAKLTPKLMAAPLPHLAQQLTEQRNHLRPAMLNLLRVQAEAHPLSEVGIKLVKQALLFLYYQCVTGKEEGANSAQKVHKRRPVLTKKLELDTLLRNQEEHVSLGVILQIVTDCAGNIVNSQLAEVKAPAGLDLERQRTSTSQLSRMTIHLSDKLISDLVVIIEVGLSLVYFHCEMFLQDILKSQNRSELRSFKEKVSQHIEGNLVRQVTDAYKRVSQSEYIETLLLKLRSGLLSKSDSI